jgi:hypothetical protein
MHISKLITFLLNEVAGSVNSYFVEHVLLHLFIIEANSQTPILLKKKIIVQIELALLGHPL